ncbi:MAG: hypothetical protein JXA73_16045 [Acidobacteria bacterium]|nr:hypothetical protein [Acidobacteriota bacterium]
MKKLAVLLPVFLFITFVSAAYSQSLAEIAKKERERRADIKDNRVITDEDVAKFKRTTPETELPAPPAAGPESPKVEEAEATAEGTGTKDDKAEKVDPDEPTDFQGRPESYWRKTMAEARQKVTDLTNEANVIVLTIADLQNKFYSMDDGFKRETIQRDLQKTYYQQDMNKENLEKAKAQLADLENEARKSGALPGWIN